MIKNTLKPILKWAGGKQQIINEILKYIPSNKNNFFCEPFVGGGSVLFSLQPQNAIINDVNSEIINVYKVIKNDHENLISELRKFKNDKNFYYRCRSLDKDPNYVEFSDTFKAARTIFLNKTCYNGLYRVNKNNQFNVPYGMYKSPNIINSDTIYAINKYFNDNKIDIYNEDFFNCLYKISNKYFVYLDPPYDLINKNSFISYNATNFNKDEHIRLKNFCDELNDMDVKFLLSNSYTTFILDLYHEYKISYVRTNRNINSKSDKRYKSSIEVLIRNY